MQRLAKRKSATRPTFDFPINLLYFTSSIERVGSRSTCPSAAGTSPMAIFCERALPQSPMDDPRQDPLLVEH